MKAFQIKRESQRQWWILKERKKVNADLRVGNAGLIMHITHRLFHRLVLAYSKTHITHTNEGIRMT